jgi:RHS repeat-associated protein
MLMNDQSFSNTAVPNTFLYNGKEFDQNTGYYQYGFRQYDAAIGRWFVVDALAEDYYSHSPYAYCMNNPIAYYDPYGLSAAAGYSTSNTSEIAQILSYFAAGGSVDFFLSAFESSVGGYSGTVTYEDGSNNLGTGGSGGRYSYSIDIDIRSSNFDRRAGMGGKLNVWQKIANFFRFGIHISFKKKWVERKATYGGITIWYPNPSNDRNEPDWLSYKYKYGQKYNGNIDFVIQTVKSLDFLMDNEVGTDVMNFAINFKGYFIQNTR